MAARLRWTARTWRAAPYYQALSYVHSEFTNLPTTWGSVLNSAVLWGPEVGMEVAASSVRRSGQRGLGAGTSYSLVSQLANTINLPTTQESVHYSTVLWSPEVGMEVVAYSVRRSRAARTWRAAPISLCACT
jgi:hypothetical protein